jgi:type IV pilus assembly protein PilW
MSTPNATSTFLRPTPKSPQPNGLVSVLRATRWYIGDNARGSKSLFRTRLTNDGGEPQPAEDEIVANADQMTLSYLVSGADSYVDSTAVADWSKVVAVRIQLHLTGFDRVDGAKVERTLEHVVAIRNRVL